MNQKVHRRIQTHFNTINRLLKGFLLFHLLFILVFHSLSCDPSRTSKLWTRPLLAICLEPFGTLPATTRSLSEDSTGLTCKPSHQFVNFPWKTYMS